MPRESDKREALLELIGTPQPPVVNPEDQLKILKQFADIFVERLWTLRPLWKQDKTTKASVRFEGSLNSQTLAIILADTEESSPWRQILVAVDKTFVSKRSESRRLDEGWTTFVSFAPITDLELTRLLEARPEIFQLLITGFLKAAIAEVSQAKRVLSDAQTFYEQHRGPLEYLTGTL